MCQTVGILSAGLNVTKPPAHLRTLHRGFASWSGICDNVPWIANSFPRHQLVGLSGLPASGGISRNDQSRDGAFAAVTTIQLSAITSVAPSPPHIIRHGVPDFAEWTRKHGNGQADAVLQAFEDEACRVPQQGGLDHVLTGRERTKSRTGESQIMPDCPAIMMESTQ